MDSKQGEKVSEKAARQMQVDGYEAGKRAIKEVAEKLVERGFDRKEVYRHVSVGVTDAGADVGYENR